MTVNFSQMVAVFYFMTIRIIKKSNIQNPKPLTLRQEKVVAMVGNGGKSKASILRQAGYSVAIINNPRRVFDSPEVKQAVDYVVRQLQYHRNSALERMEQTIDKASYGTLVRALHILTKSIDLLESRPTVIDHYELSDEKKARLDKMLRLNS